MAMGMGRAFSSKFLRPLVRYTVGLGSYNEFNDWVEGTSTATPIMGVVRSGNKFSRFEKGKAVHNEDGGTRHSEYKSLYIESKYGLKLGDYVSSRGLYYNVLQESDESDFGFQSFLLEKTLKWSPNV